MSLNVNEQANFLKDNIYLIIILIVILSPVIWLLSGLYYQGRIDQYKVQIETLQMQNDNLKNKSDGYKDLLTEESTTNWAAIKSN